MSQSNRPVLLVSGVVVVDIVVVVVRFSDPVYLGSILSLLLVYDGTLRFRILKKNLRVIARAILG
jgi:hypothetical protein